MDAVCQCGNVRFKTPLKQPLALYICHCDECRRQSGSAFGSSAIFPKFPIPCRDELSLYSRPTASGGTLDCYFCKNCGTRLIHSSVGKDTVSVKSGCILDHLDWKSAHHIWTRHAVVPIPDGVESSLEEPENEDYSAASNNVNPTSSEQTAKNPVASKPTFASKTKALFSSKPYNPEEEAGSSSANNQGKK